MEWSIQRCCIVLDELRCKGVSRVAENFVHNVVNRMTDQLDVVRLWETLDVEAVGEDFDEVVAGLRRLCVFARGVGIANVCEFGCTDDCDCEFDVFMLVLSTEMGMRMWDWRVGSDHIPPVLVGDISPSFKSSAPTEFAETSIANNHERIKANRNILDVMKNFSKRAEASEIITMRRRWTLWSAKATKLRY